MGPRPRRPRHRAPRRRRRPDRGSHRYLRSRLDPPGDRDSGRSRRPDRRYRGRRRYRRSRRRHQCLRPRAPRPPPARRMAAQARAPLGGRPTPAPAPPSLRSRPPARSRSHPHTRRTPGTSRAHEHGSCRGSARTPARGYAATGRSPRCEFRPHFTAELDVAPFLSGPSHRPRHSIRTGRRRRGPECPPVDRDCLNRGGDSAR
jgi:hypothetical protein